jgi:multimeric flavodoxin WrbA
VARLLLVHHTPSPATHTLLEAVRAGATDPQITGVELVVRAALAATASDVLAADGYLFATPENLASMAGLMKDFFDRCYYAALDRINGRPYAALVCAGSDGQNAARQIVRIATGWRLRAVADPIIVYTHAETPDAIFAPKVIGSDDLGRCEELGAALAAGLVIGTL